MDSKLNNGFQYFIYIYIYGTTFINVQIFLKTSILLVRIVAYYFLCVLYNCDDDDNNNNM